MEHLKNLGRIGLGSRMKRFGDYLIGEVNAIYKNDGIPFEASCFPLLSLVERYGPMSLRDAEQRLGTSHSYVSQKAKYLQKEKLITLRPSISDARSKEMHLTDRGRALIDRARPLWKAMDIAFARLLGEDERKIFSALDALENRMMDAPALRQSVADMLRPADDGGKIEVADYSVAYASAFAELNLEWLEKNFTLQDFDYKVFEDPEKNLIKKGGDIWFAILDGRPVGTAALYPEAPGVLELCKMSVAPQCRGMGIGRLLAEEGIARARAMGVEKITLLTNSRKLAPALRMYRDLGFRDIPLTEEDTAKYGTGRVDVRMEMLLKAKKRRPARR